MASKSETVTVNVKSNIGETTKDASELAGEFKIMGVSLNTVTSSLQSAGRAAKASFATMKAGIASTGIGALIIAIGSLTQYFRDSEEGASKFKQITSQLGVVMGNVTDIVSNLGKGIFSLVTGDFTAFKESMGDLKKGVLEFGETTRKEMKQANQLEKDRLALQKFEREAIVEKARTEKDMMELRLKARDEENFSTQERLKFMREANKLAGEQLEKDLHVAREKLRFQQEENSFSKSTQENLDAEAQLQAQVFQIERSNFSERKRLKSEEQALVKQARAQEIAIAKEKEDEAKAEADRLAKLAEEEQLVKDEREEKLAGEAQRLKEVRDENFLAEIEDLKERAKERLRIEYEAQLEEIADYENFLELKAELDKKYTRDVKALDKEQVSWSEMSGKQKGKIASDTAGNLATILGEETAAGQAMAITQATIDTYQSAQSSFKSMSGIPIVGPALGAIAAAAAIAAGMQNIAAIKGAGKGGGGGGGGAARGAAASAPPAPQMMSGEFNLSGGIEPEPTRAYVVTDEMTDRQNQLANIRRRATI